MDRDQAMYDFLRWNDQWNRRWEEREDMKRRGGVKIVYESLSAFYEERGGAKSGEADYGVWWREGPLCFRVSLVFDTGDIYAEMWTVGHSPAGEGTGRVELLGTVEGTSRAETYPQVEALLEGWADVCGAFESLQWVRERLAPVRP